MSLLLGYSDVVQLLLEHGAIVGATDHHSSTPLHLACQKGNQKTVVRDIEHLYHVMRYHIKWPCTIVASWY